MDEPNELQQEVAEWEAKLIRLANERDTTQIRLPRTDGKKVNREQIAEAFVTSFELVGGIPRLAHWADANYTEFVKIFGRLLPKESVQVHDGAVHVIHSVAPSKLDKEDGAPRLVSPPDPIEGQSG